MADPAEELDGIPARVTEVGGLAPEAFEIVTFKDEATVPTGDEPAGDSVGSSVGVAQRA